MPSSSACAYISTTGYRSGQLLQHSEGHCCVCALKLNTSHLTALEKSSLRCFKSYVVIVYSQVQKVQDSTRSGCLSSLCFLMRSVESFSLSNLTDLSKLCITYSYLKSLLEKTSRMRKQPYGGLTSVGSLPRLCAAESWCPQGWRSAERGSQLGTGSLSRW